MCLIRTVCLLWFLIPCGFASANVRLPNVLSDHMVLQQGKPINVWGWADVGEAVTVTFGKTTAKTVADDEGRWVVQIPKQEANATPASLVVAGNNTIRLDDILVGEVWICSGQSNMEWSMQQTQNAKEEIAAAQYPDIRLYNVIGHINKPEPQDDAPGKWQACTPESVAKFSGVGYHFGKSLHAKLNVPIGLVGSNWGGTRIEPWTPKIGLEQVETLKSKASNGGIYNGMVHPLVPLSMRGITWYQGESNCLGGDTSIYTDRTLALVRGWRSAFKQKDLSFYFVQIAPFAYEQRFKARNENLNAESLPRFWDAQTACMSSVSNCGMAVITDVTGDVNNIHPSNKRDVGDRLARWALAKDYGDSSIVFSGPMFDSIAFDGRKATVRFHHIGSGLKSLDGKPLVEFKIAGKDKQFFVAQAHIEGDSVVVESSEVKAPVAVRFAWQETAIGNLGNAEGLPAIPFRSDAW